MGQLDHALIGNCQSSALIDRGGTLVWCCLPRFDSEAVFCALLGGSGAGLWSCLPESSPYEARQRYLQNTNIVVTEYHLSGGDRYDVVDFMPRFHEEGGYYHSPQIIRIIRTIRGNPRVRVRFEPRFDYGKVVPDASVTGEGLVYRKGAMRIFLATDVPATYLLEGRAFELDGDRYFVLSHGEPFARPLRFGCEEFLDRTADYWRRWVKHCSIPFEFQDAVIRSALALKLHIFEDTGAIIASPTTSIPEGPDGGRTSDYRYCWLRDAYFVINVLNRLGQFEEMEKFIQFLHNIAVTGAGEGLQPVYGITGERTLTERELPWLEGFGGAGPVRVGNAAHAREQHDVYGEMVLAVTPLFFDSRLDRIDHGRAFENVKHLVEQAIAAFGKPEGRSGRRARERRSPLFSKLMCWAALDRGVKIAAKMGTSGELERWREIRDRMRARIELGGCGASAGRRAGGQRGPRPDAASLLMATLNFSSARDEGFRGMVERYEKLLMEDGAVFRHRDDDFGAPKHSFVICSFWVIDALAALGRGSEAREIFARVLSRANHVGLLSEEIDPGTGELWGNFPRAYSHVGVINCAFRLSGSWDDAF